MAKIGLFYGTQTGKTETVAELIQKEFGGDLVAMYEIADADAEDFDAFERIIIAAPTWNVGELSSDWEGFFEELDSIDFTSKTVAYCGTGDQVGYADNYLDAIGILEEKISNQGGETIGQWPIQGYDFSESKAVKDGKFVGLAIDEDNQPELTATRIKQWVSQIRPAFGL
jgi:flavodoxin I